MLRSGNAMKRRSISFNIEAERAIAASLMDVFNLETLGRSESRGCPSDLPILIVGMPRSGTSLVELGAYYRIYDGLMAYWHRVMPDAILEVAYEDLVAVPKSTIQAKLAHCNLSWDDACLAFHRTDRPVRTASAAQVRKPLYGSSVGRRRRYEKHLKPLIQALGPSVPSGAVYQIT